MQECTNMDLLVFSSLFCLKKHIKETKSSFAEHILDELDRYEPYFWLVSPAALKVKDLLKATTANAA